MKPLPDFEPIPLLEKQLEFLKVFEEMEIDAPILKDLEESHGNPDKLQEVMKDPNLYILWLKLKLWEEFEPESKYKKAFINLLKLDLVLFKYNPWWRSRRGHDMWWSATYQNPDSYYPLGWEMHYDPTQAYRVGEPPRPPGTEDMPPLRGFGLKEPATEVHD